MANPSQIKLVEGKEGFNPTVAMLAGAVVGAGAALIGVIALKDENNREKVKEVFTNIKDQAVGYVEDAQKQAETEKGEVKEKLIEGKEKVKKVAQNK